MSAKWMVVTTVAKMVAEMDNLLVELSVDLMAVKKAL